MEAYAACSEFEATSNMTIHAVINDTTITQTITTHLTEVDYLTSDIQFSIENAVSIFNLTIGTKTVGISASYTTPFTMTVSGDDYTGAFTGSDSFEITFVDFLTDGIGEDAFAMELTSDIYKDTEKVGAIKVAANGDVTVYNAQVEIISND